MTSEELQAEWEYRYEERLGMLCGAQPPTKEQTEIAEREAQAAIKDLIEHANADRTPISH